MDLVWAIIVLLGVSHFTFGSESGRSLRPIHLNKRNILPRLSPRNPQTLSENPDDDLPGRVVYQVNDDLPTLYSSSLSYDNLPSDTDAFVRRDAEDPSERSSYTDDAAPFIFGDRLQQPNLSQNWQTYGKDMYTYDSSNSVKENNNNNKSNDDVISPVDEEERLMLQKRMQIKGMGLLGGSPKAAVGQSSLTGASKSRNKGLVLSIDLGIKALRDAIMHAKFQQKNKQHQMQAQKNMRLLHNIGKRRAQYLTQGRL